MNLSSGNIDKIKQMLGKGLSPTVVSSALGITESYISQLLANRDFAQAVAELRLVQLESHSARDATYDKIEDELLDKLKDVLPYMVKPGEILASIKIINSAKRRGVDPTANGTNLANNTIINLVLPTHVVTNYSTNAMGQVVEAEHHSQEGEVVKQSLITMPSGNLNALLSNKDDESKTITSSPETSQDKGSREAS